MSKINRVVLYGGGLDSTVLLAHLRKVYPTDEITVMHIDYGQKAVHAERASAEYFAKTYNATLFYGKMDLSYSGARIMKGTDIGTEARSNKLELRNMVLISYAASYACSVFKHAVIYVGFHKEPEGSCFPDARTDYLKSLNASITLASGIENTLHVTAPFEDATRRDILEYGISLNPDIPNMSHTCYEQEACGQCTHCVEKEQMLKQIGNK